jgi:hypothetical protein
MERQERIHIIASGANIGKTVHLAIKEEPHISRIFVIVEKDICRDSSKDSEARKNLKKSIRDAISEVREISRRMKIHFETILIDTITIESVRDAVLSIYDTYPDSEYSFNISGGTKPLSNGLFLMSIWVQGTVYHTPTDDTIQRLFIPKMHPKDISQNVNYGEILDCLSGSAKNSPEITGEAGRDIYREMKKRYTPIRETGDRKTKRTYARGTLTKNLATLIEWGLVSEMDHPKSKKEKMYSITEDGKFALKFFLMQKKKKSVTS